MFNFVAAAFGSVTVEEANGKIKITAIRSKDALNEIYNYYRTSRIEQNMFTKISTYTLEFYSFFAVEFTYILDQLIEKPGRSQIAKSTLKKVKEGMLTNTWLSSTQKDHDPIFNRSKLSIFSKTPLRHQAEFFDHFENIAPKFNLKGYALGMGTGTGKATTLDSLVKVPGGWKRMGDIQVGDWVTAWDGKPTRVLAVYPQGVTEVWRVHFTDGRYLDVNPEHLWGVRYTHYDELTTVDTIYLKSLLDSREKVYIPIALPEEGDDIDLPLDPVTLGQELRTGTGQYSRVPEIYFSASTEQRSKLLQAITNGILKGIDSFTSVNLGLIKDVQYLVRSLGGSAEIKDFGDDSLLVIRYRLSSLAVDFIEEMTPVETQCITVEHPDHLYVTNDFIVTHNTFTTLAACAMLEPDITIVVSLKASLYRVWEDAMLEDFKTPPKYWILDRDKHLPSTLPPYLIYHFDALSYLLENSSRFTGKKVALILDESHNLNEMTSARTQQIMTFCQRVNPMVVFWASATPIKAFGSEAIPMLSTFDPLMTPEVQKAFLQLYGKSSKKCFDIIRHRMGNVVFRVDVVKSKPIIESVPIQLKDPSRFLLSTLKTDMRDYIIERIRYWKEQEPQVKIGYYNAVDKYERTLKTSEQKAALAQYRRCVTAISKTTDYVTVKEEMVFCNKFEKNNIEPLLQGQDLKDFRSFKSVVKYLPLKVRGECLGNVVGKRREEATLAMIEGCNLPGYIDGAEKKTIVFTSYVKAVEQTASYLIKEGYRPVTVYGAGKEDLTSQVKKFFDDKSANPLVATYQSLSTSVPLTAANVILAINAPFRDYIFEQAVGRIDRINQDAQTYVYKFYLDTKEPNISSRTMDILEWSEEQVNQILGVKEEAIALEAYSLMAIPQYT